MEHWEPNHGDPRRGQAGERVQPRDARQRSREDGSISTEGPAYQLRQRLPRELLFGRLLLLLVVVVVMVVMMLLLMMRIHFYMYIIFVGGVSSVWQ